MRAAARSPARRISRTSDLRLLVFELRLHQLRVAEDRGEEVVEVVRDTAREAADPLHFPRLDELLFESGLLGRGVAQIAGGPLGRDARVDLRARDREERAAHDESRHEEKGDAVRAGAGVESVDGRHGQGPRGACHLERGSPLEARRLRARAVGAGTVKESFRVRLRSREDLVTDAGLFFTLEDRVQEVVGAEGAVHDPFQGGAAVAHGLGRHAAAIAGQVNDETRLLAPDVVDQRDPARRGREAGVPGALHRAPSNGLAEHVVADGDPVPVVVRLEVDHGLVFVPRPLGPHAKVRDILAHRGDQGFLVLPEDPPADPHPLYSRIVLLELRLVHESPESPDGRRIGPRRRGRGWRAETRCRCPSVLRFRRRSSGAVSRT